MSSTALKCTLKMFIVWDIQTYMDTCRDTVHTMAVALVRGSFNAFISRCPHVTFKMTPLQAHQLKLWPAVGASLLEYLFFRSLVYKFIFVVIFRWHSSPPQPQKLSYLAKECCGIKAGMYFRMSWGWRNTVFDEVKKMMLDLNWNTILNPNWLRWHNISEEWLRAGDLLYY